MSKLTQPQRRALKKASGFYLKAVNIRLKDAADNEVCHVQCCGRIIDELFWLRYADLIEEEPLRSRQVIVKICSDCGGNLGISL